MSADFNFVNERLATGAGINSLEDAQAIAAAGITHIIDCRDDLDDTQFFTQLADVTVLWNGTADDGQAKPSSWFQTSVDFALQNLVKPHTKIYAHCAAGINRGPSTCYAILRAMGLNPTQAEEMIRAARPQVGLAYKKDADAAVTVLYD